MFRCLLTSSDKLVSLYQEEGTRPPSPPTTTPGSFLRSVSAGWLAVEAPSTHAAGLRGRGRQAEKGVAFLPIRDVFPAFLAFHLFFSNNVNFLKTCLP